MPALAEISDTDLIREFRRRGLPTTGPTAVDLDLPHRLPCRLITLAAAEAYRLPPETLFRRGRDPLIVAARQSAMALMRELLGISYPAIGGWFGHTHGSAMHAVQTAAAPAAEHAVHSHARALAVAALGPHSRRSP